MEIEVYIDEDEWYPVYTVVKALPSYNYGNKAIIPEELLEEYHKADHEFELVQDKLRKYYEGDRA